MSSFCDFFLQLPVCYIRVGKVTDRERRGPNLLQVMIRISMWNRNGKLIDLLVEACKRVTPRTYLPRGQRKFWTWDDHQGFWTLPNKMGLRLIIKNAFFYFYFFLFFIFIIISSFYSSSAGSLTHSLICF